MMRSHFFEREPPPTASARSTLAPAWVSAAQAVGEGEGDAFQHGAGERRLVGGVAETDEAAADGGIVVRRALAAEIGQEQHVAGAAAIVLERLGERGGAGREDVRQPFERAGRRKDDAHLVPGVGHGVAEGVDGGRRVGREAGIGDEEHAGGAERDEGGARLDHADAAGRRGIVAAAAGHHHACAAMPQRLREFGAQRAGRGRALDRASASGRA